ncbi:MAG: FecR family protein, partial [Candidatus Obscuribacterales bacterium]|nr:FecR family protein [Candidatus Obscuribacterales bacterium]
MHRGARKLIVSATLLLAVFLPGSNAFASSGEIQAKLTEAHGDVFKRGFVDWEREIWEDPSPAQRGDVLHEGMQIGTGTKSWAQLSWPNVTARAWANSLYAIAPQQRLVYLLNGEMLYHLDKNRKDKKAYVVWTKLIQARIRGTTVLFQTTGDTTRMTVLEGTVEVMNRLDKSIVRVTPGVVYEVKDKLAMQSTVEKHSATNDAPINTSQLNSDIKDKLSGAVTTVGNALPTSGAQTGALSEIAANVPVTTLFETKRTLTSLFVINPQSLLSHPLLTTLEQPLSSLPLVQSTLTPLISKVDSIVKGGIDPLNQQLLGSLQVLTVPKSLTYKVGPGLGTAFVLPQAALSYFPPTGYIGNAPGTALQAGAGPNAHGIANGASTLLNGSASLTQTTNSLTNMVPGAAFGGFQ